MIGLPTGDSNEERRAIACSSVKVQTAAPVERLDMLKAVASPSACAPLQTFFANEDLPPESSRGRNAAVEREMQLRFPTVPSRRRGQEAAGSEMRSRSRLTG
jgi:hypothetical protein